MERIWNSLRGPELYHIYQKNNVASHFYNKNIAERFSGSIIKWMSTFWNYKTWLSPIFLIVAYKKDWLNWQGLQLLLPYMAAIIVLILASQCVRGFGRLLSTEYQVFLADLTAFQKLPTADNKRKVSMYDFCFSDWPVEYTATQFSSKTQSHYRNCNYPLYLFSGICVNTFGVRLLYPGSMSFLFSMLNPSLMEGREKLMMQHKGQRSKLRTADHNHIDTIFIDHRADDTPQGQKLVVCSDGNAGFYEIGCMSTPLEAGFSVVGWNHPGFSGSTGEPTPSQEQRAMDAVMQYCVNILSFQPHEIILFAWSIGGYNASWAAMTYPDVHSVVLDASFDHIQPLALSHMPRSWRWLIDLAIPNHLNLNNAQLLCKYPGKIQLVRRLKDETISTSESSQLESNRGNNLLMEIFTHRYPHLMNSDGIKALKLWLSADKLLQGVLLKSYEIGEDTVSIENNSNNETFPSEFGADMENELKEKALICLAREHMTDFDSTHCTHLPGHLFRNLPGLKAL